MGGKCYVSEYDNKLSYSIGDAFYDHDICFDIDCEFHNYYDAVLCALNDDFMCLTGVSESIEPIDSHDIHSSFLLQHYSKAAEYIKSQIDNNIKSEKLKHFVNHVLLLDNKNGLNSKKRMAAYGEAFGISDLFEYSIDILNSSEAEDNSYNKRVTELNNQKSANHIDAEEAFRQYCNLNQEYEIPIVEDKFFNSFSDMIKYLLFKMVKCDCCVKTCKNCGKYFVPNRADALYCDNISPQEKIKTCKEYGKYQTYLNKSQTDEATKLYKQIYNAKANKIKRCNNSKLQNELFDIQQKAADFRKNIKSGIATQEAYIEWLKSIKTKEGE